MLTYNKLIESILIEEQKEIQDEIDTLEKEIVFGGKYEFLPIVDAVGNPTKFGEYVTLAFEIARMKDYNCKTTISKLKLENQEEILKRTSNINLEIQSSKQFLKNIKNCFEQLKEIKNLLVLENEISINKDILDEFILNGESSTRPSKTGFSKDIIQEALANIKKYITLSNVDIFEKIQSEISQTDKPTDLQKINPFDKYDQILTAKPQIDIQSLICIYSDILKLSIGKNVTLQDTTLMSSLGLNKLSEISDAFVGSDSALPYRKSDVGYFISFLQFLEDSKYVLPYAVSKSKKYIRGIENLVNDGYEDLEFSNMQNWISNNKNISANFEKFLKSAILLGENSKYHQVDIFKSFFDVITSALKNISAYDAANVHFLAKNDPEILQIYLKLICRTLYSKLSNGISGDADSQTSVVTTYTNSGESVDKQNATIQTVKSITKNSNTVRVIARYASDSQANDELLSDLKNLVIDNSKSGSPDYVFLLMWSDFEESIKSEVAGETDGLLSKIADYYVSTISEEMRDDSGYTKFGKFDEFGLVSILVKCISLIFHKIVNSDHEIINLFDSICVSTDWEQKLGLSLSSFLETIYASEPDGAILPIGTYGILSYAFYNVVEYQQNIWAGFLYIKTILSQIESAFELLVNEKDAFSIDVESAMKIDAEDEASTFTTKSANNMLKNMTSQKLINQYIMLQQMQPIEDSFIPSYLSFQDIKENVFDLFNVQKNKYSVYNIIFKNAIPGIKKITVKKMNVLTDTEESLEYTVDTTLYCDYDFILNGIYKKIDSEGGITSYSNVDILNLYSDLTLEEISSIKKFAVETYLFSYFIFYMTGFFVSEISAYENQNHEVSAATNSLISNIILKNDCLQSLLIRSDKIVNRIYNNMLCDKSYLVMLDLNTQSDLVYEISINEKSEI